MHDGKHGQAHCRFSKCQCFPWKQLRIQNVGLITTRSTRSLKSVGIFELLLFFLIHEFFCALSAVWNDVTCYEIHIFHQSRFYMPLSDCITVNATHLSYGSLFDKMQNSLFLNATLISSMHNVHRLYCISWKYRNILYWSCLWLKSVLCFMLQIINEIICILKRKNWKKVIKKYSLLYPTREPLG